MQQACIISSRLHIPVSIVGRIAGQYGKPRTKSLENVEGKDIPIYRGDNINSFEPVLNLRQASPNRLEKGYYLSALSLNYLRSFSISNFSELFQSLSSCHSDIKKRDICSEVISSIPYFNSSTVKFYNLNRPEFFISHEGLILHYEQALTQKQNEGSYYNIGAHMLWIGDRTRSTDGAHVEYFRGIENPVGIKIGPDYNCQDILQLVKSLNPLLEEGKIILIPRFGRKHVESKLPPLLEVFARSKQPVCWLIDPMHGNTIKTQLGYKSRYFQDIYCEFKLAQRIFHSFNIPIGGIHLEMTGDNISECLGGASNTQESQLVHGYKSYCDPRLNYWQSLELALLISQAYQSTTSVVWQ